MTAAKLLGPITIDGKLDEAAWAQATPSSDFTQSYPQPGAPSLDRTEVRILFDADAMYVGVRMFDSHPDSIAAQLARRDASGIYSDWLHVMIDSYHDRRTGFRFSVNPRGVKKDVLHSDDGTEDLNWDAVWQVGTTVDSLGWIAEYRIPFSQLRFGTADAGEVRTWGFGVMRDVARRNERDTWSPWTPQDGGFVSRWGDLTGIVDISSSHHAELLPYVSTRVTHAPASPGNPFYNSYDTKPSAGADFKVGMPGGLTLTGTVNPDFGQVEVDPAVVNLTAFETFFPEKRPFFVEGAGIFTFGQTRAYNSYQSETYFYSRRVGRSPQRFLGGGTIRYADAPDQTTILGAAKLSGRVAGWTVGLLDAVTDEERADFQTTADVRGTAAVEPRSNYLVARTRRDFRNGNTVIGGIFTATHRDLEDPALASMLRSRALMAGADFEHSWNNHGYYLSGYLAGSNVAGSPQVMAAAQQSSARYYQRPDQDYVSVDPSRTSLTGSIAELAIQKTGKFIWSLDAKQVTPGLELNDIGFQSRGDYRSAATLLGYQTFQAGKLFQSFSTNIGSTTAWNFGSTRIYDSYFANVNSTFNNFWSAYLHLGYDQPVLSDRITRGGPLARVPGELYSSVSVSSDSRRMVAAGLGLSASADDEGGDQTSVSADISIRPASFLRITAGPSLSRTYSTMQFVGAAPDAAATATYGNRYLFGGLHQTTLSAVTRVEWTFTPTLSFQLYAQPFVSAVRFSEFRELLEAGTGQFGTFGVDHGTVSRDATTGAYTVDPDGTGSASAIALGNPDFNTRSLRGNAVVRWEYRPGSTLYFVWQQQRAGSEGIGDFDLNRDAGAIFRQPMTNVFLVKATFWVAR